MSSKRVFFSGCIGLALIIAVMAGCALSPVDPGKEKENNPPEVFFLNTYSINDTTIVSYKTPIYWYGTDADGFIDHYEEIIEEPVLKSSVYGDSTGYFTLSDEMDIICDVFDNNADLNPGDSLQNSKGDYYKYMGTSAKGEKTWYLVSSDHGAIISKYFIQQNAASTSDTITFYTPFLKNLHRFWLRAVDNMGAASEVKYIDFLSETEAPEIHLDYFCGYTLNPSDSILVLNGWEQNVIDLDSAPDSVISIFNRNPNWPGIWFSWEASDPDSGVIEFYKYRLDDGEITTLPANSMLLDCVENVSGAKNSITVPGVVLDDVPEGEHDFYVWAVDDAGAESVLPAVYHFNAFVPTRQKDVLVVDATWYGDESFISPTEASMLHPHLKNHPEFIEMFYSDLFDELNLDYDFIRLQDPADGTPNLNLDVLGDYKSVVWLQETLNPIILQSHKRIANYLFMIQEYLNTGGKFFYLGYDFNNQIDNSNFIDHFGKLSSVSTLSTYSMYGFYGETGLPFNDQDSLVYNPDWLWEIYGYYYPIPNSCTFSFETMNDITELSKWYGLGSSNGLTTGYVFSGPFWNFAVFGAPLYPLVDPKDDGGDWIVYDEDNRPFTSGMDEESRSLLITYFRSFFSYMDLII